MLQADAVVRALLLLVGVETERYAGERWVVDQEPVLLDLYRVPPHDCAAHCLALH